MIMTESGSGRKLAWAFNAPSAGAAELQFPFSPHAASAPPISPKMYTAEFIPHFHYLKSNHDFPDTFIPFICKSYSTPILCYPFNNSMP